LLKIKWFLALLFLLILISSTIVGFAADNKVIAYYFHGSARCTTCHKMEEYAKEAIKSNFPDELANGMLVFRAVNIEEKNNKHFIDEYQLYTKALIISQVKDSKEIRHKNLTKIWEYARNKDKFSDYVTEEIKNYLEG